MALLPSTSTGAWQWPQVASNHAFSAYVFWHVVASAAANSTRSTAGRLFDEIAMSLVR